MKYKNKVSKVSKVKNILNNCESDKRSNKYIKSLGEIRRIEIPLKVKVILESKIKK